MPEPVKTDSIHTVEPDDIQPPPHYNPAKGPQVITADTARQGPRGGRVLIVLVVAMAAVGIAWLLVNQFAH
jgi:hypothetical protein